MKTMKKAISVLLLVCMVSALCSAGAYADNTAGTGGESSTTPDFHITLDKAYYTAGTDSTVTATASGFASDITTTEYKISWYVNDNLSWECPNYGQLSATWNLSELNNGDKLYATATKDSATLKSQTVTVNIVDPNTQLTASITQEDNTLTAHVKRGSTDITSFDQVEWIVMPAAEGQTGGIKITSASNPTATIASADIYADQSATIKAKITIGKETVETTTPVSIPATGVHVNSITLSSENPVLVKGSNVKITATIDPSNATDQNISWTDNPDVLDVTSDGVFTVKSGANIKNGDKVSVTATVDGKTATTSITLSVPSTQAKALVLTATDGRTTIDAYSNVQLNYSVEPADAGVGALTWTSSDPSIATVDKNGLVTGVKSGTVKITAQAADLSNSANVVTGEITINVTSIKVNKIELVSSTSIEVGNNQAIVASVLPTNAENRALTWSSSDPNVATVTYDSNDSSKVTITAKKVGTAVITATATDNSGVSAACTVTVTEPAAYKINLTPNTITLGQGNVNYFTATILDKDGKNVSGSDKSITWSFTGDTSDGIGITSNGYNSTNNNYTATVLGKFNRNYVVTASCSIGGVVYSSSASVTVSFTPAIVSGQNAVYNGRDAMSFVVNDSAQNFNGHVYVDGRELSNVYYSTSNYNGYLVVTLNQSFLNFLCQYYNNNGYHTLSVDTKYGAAASYFRTWGTASSFNGVKTGDDANLDLWAALLAVSAVGAGAAVIIVKRRKTNNG